jgi:hypothetical protein
MEYPGSPATDQAGTGYKRMIPFADRSTFKEYNPDLTGKEYTCVNMGSQ